MGFLGINELSSSKFPLKMQFNQEAAIEPRHLTSISRFSYLLLNYLVYSLFKPIKNYDSSEVVYKNYAIFSPLSDYFTVAESSSSDPGIDIKAIVEQNQNQSSLSVLVYFRRPILFAISDSGSKVFEGDTRLVLLIPDQSGIISQRGLSLGTYYVYVSINESSLNNSLYFPQQRTASGSQVDVFYYNKASLEIRNSHPSSGKYAILAKVSVSSNGTINLTKYFPQNIWYIPSVYVPVGSFSKVLSSFEGLEFSKVVDSILKYSHLFPGTSGYLAFSKGIMSRGPADRLIAVSLSSSGTVTVSMGEWPESSFVFGNGVLYTTMNGLWNLMREKSEKVKSSISGTTSSFKTFFEDLTASTAPSNVVTGFSHTLPSSFYSEVEKAFFVFGLYYDPSDGFVIPGYIFPETPNAGSVNYSVFVGYSGTSPEIPSIFSVVTDDRSAADFCRRLVEDSSAYNIGVGSNFPSAEVHGESAVVIRNIALGNFLPLYVIKVSKGTSGNTNFSVYSLVKTGHISPSNVNLFSLSLVPWSTNNANVNLESLKKFTGYSLLDFIRDLKNCVVKNSTDVNQATSHPILGGKLVSLNNSGVIDWSLLPEGYCTGEETVVYLQGSIVNNERKSYVSFEDFKSVLKSVLTNLRSKGYSRVRVAIVPDPSATPMPGRIFVFGSYDKVIDLADLFGGSFGSLNEVSIYLGLPIQNDSIRNQQSRFRIIIDSSVPVPDNFKLILDSWNFSGSYETNLHPYYYPLEIQIGRDDLQKSNNPIPQNLSGLILVLKNVKTGSNSTICFGKRAHYFDSGIRSDVVFYDTSKDVLVSSWFDSNRNSVLLKEIHIEDSAINIAQDGILAKEDDRAISENIILAQLQGYQNNRYPVLLHTGVYISSRLRFVNSKIYFQFRCIGYPSDLPTGSRVVDQGGYSVSPVFMPLSNSRVYFDIKGCTITFSPLPAHRFGWVNLSNFDIPRLFLNYSLFGLKENFYSSITDSVFFVETHSKYASLQDSGFYPLPYAYQFVTYSIYLVKSDPDGRSYIFVKGNIIKTYTIRIGTDEYVDDWYNWSGLGSTYHYYTPLGNYFRLFSTVVNFKDNSSGIYPRLQYGGDCTNGDWKTHIYYSLWHARILRDGTFYCEDPDSQNAVDRFKLIYRPVHPDVLSSNNTTRNLRGSDTYKLIYSFMMYNMFDPVNYSVTEPGCNQ